jgi:hypothetical protein
MKRRKASRFGYFFHSNCLLNHVIEGKIEQARRRERRRKQLLVDLKETRRYWSLKKSEAILYIRLGLEEVMDVHQDRIPK